MAGMIKLDDFVEQLAQAKADAGKPSIATALMQTAEKVMNTVGADFGVSKDDACYALKDFPVRTEDKGKREVISYISSIALDRDNEALLTEGAILDDYRENAVVLWAHQYDQLAVGRNIWIVPEDDDTVLKARTRYTTQKSNPLGVQLYNYRKEKNPLAESVGFVPIEWVKKEDKEFGAVFDSWLERYTAFMQGMGREMPEKIKPDTIFTKWVLLEYSDVMVPSNPFAVTVAVEKGLLTEEDIEKYTIKTVVKTVIPYKKHSLAPESSAWDGPKERSAAEVSDLKIMSTWYDSEKPDVKGSYKLHHHKASGHNTVWRGVATAMVALLGGRGGVSIPSGDKKGVYNHLAKHYKEFDKPVPEFKEYDVEGLKAVEDSYDMESVKTSGGEVAGAWEPVEIEERDPIEAMRREGLEKAEDGFIPVSVSMWNEMCSTVKVASVKSDAYLQQVYGGISPPDGKWNKSLSEAFDLPVLEDVTSSFNYTLYADYLDCEIKNIYMNSYEIPSPLLGTYLDTIQRATEDFKVHDIRRFTSKGEESPPITANIQLKAKEFGEYLVDGTKFCEIDGYKVILDFEPSWFGLDFRIITSIEDSENNRKVMSDIHQIASENNMLKGEKFSLSGEFLDPTDEEWDDVIIPDDDKTAIQKSMGVLADGKSRGLLMVGPPGTGKTLTGRVMMNVTDATYIWVSSRDFGYSASSRIINLAFNMARRLAPTVLFMEDIDGWLGGGSTDAMKTEMDGIRATKGVMTVLTTNFPQRLPKALVDRPGRFHHVILFDLPDVRQRHQMLAKWTDDVDEKTLIDIAKQTEGFSGAHIRELVDYAEFIAEEEGISTGKSLLRSMEKLQEQRELVASFDTEKGATPDMIEYTDEEFDLMVKQELKIREQDEAIKLLRHSIAELNGKTRVLLGGVG